MEPGEILRDGLRSMHGLLDRAVTSMTVEQLNYRPQPGAMGAAFSLWHYVRTEDNIVNFVAQGRPTVWLDGAYDRAFGLPRNSQGTGMSTDEAAAVRIDDLPRFLAYQQGVWVATDAFLAGLSAADLEGKRLAIRPLGEMRLWDALFNVCLAHGNRHAGEIEYARGLQGLGGLTI